MIQFHLKDILGGTGGSLISSAVGAQLFTGVSIDSRTVKEGEIFFALRGEFHDGHDHLREAAGKGAALTVVDRKAASGKVELAPVPVIVVEDTLKALQSLASYWRDRHTLPVLAVVGSVGKTTTKEMMASILSTTGPCLKTTGNLNNQIGLPLSLLELADYHKYAVLEIGTNISGEVRYLTSLLKPVAAVLTRIGWAHLEGFKTMENLVAEKRSVLEEIPASGWCAINADDPNQADFAKSAACDVITYGIGSGDVTAEGIILSEKETSFILTLPSGKERVNLRGFGRHFVENALAAVASTLPLKVPVEKMVAGLSAWKPTNGRGEISSPLPGVHFIDDTYNANPLSVQAALASLAQFSQVGVTVAILGEMKELGDYFETGHTQAGSDVAQFGIDYLIAVGPAAHLIAKGARAGGMDPARITECGDNDEAALSLEPLLTDGVWVLFKGSRASKMEQILEHFGKPHGDNRVSSGGI
ncbi:MAG: UDP-N-acetylmuramoyl-tripeptide--D-alanyl-D-alanine ligase [bacterium]|nr:UDP-N-acetylmuramoyl-tripeptide--D-alanyl-D-alanine ligase [bacterium]MDT8365034.1 UDP-N-acetylmuramoyl-tripeptide--D-alanyl-D-alanine ligase [bacterium]